jgi:AhpD family alkylhydroperoxidase
MSYGRAVFEELREPSRALRRAIPEVYDGYRQMHAAAFAGGALDEKTKEFIALAIAVNRECDGCVASHARGAARTGATESEVAEAIRVTIAMNGGPATVYGARASQRRARRSQPSHEARRRRRRSRCEVARTASRPLSRSDLDSISGGFREAPLGIWLL